MRKTQFINYFNPRSREGSDILGKSSMSNISNFNPRSREGSDFDNDSSLQKYLISIHAPAKGATQKGFFCIIFHRFQSTLPRRERLCRRLSFYQMHLYFNPRSREGSDIIKQLKLFISLAFQSTLPRRERHNSFESRFLIIEFQSTLPRRERPW